MAVNIHSMGKNNKYVSSHNKLNKFLSDIYEYSILPQVGGRTGYYVIGKGKGDKRYLLM